MLVTLGDGRLMECANGITRLPPGPMPEVLDAEVMRFDTAHSAPRVPVMRRGYFGDEKRAREFRWSPELAMRRALLDPLGGRAEADVDSGR